MDTHVVVVVVSGHLAPLIASSSHTVLSVSKSIREAVSRELLLLLLLLLLLRVEWRRTKRLSLGVLQSADGRGEESDVGGVLYFILIFFVFGCYPPGNHRRAASAVISADRARAARSSLDSR